MPSVYTTLFTGLLLFSRVESVSACFDCTCSTEFVVIFFVILGFGGVVIPTAKLIYLCFCAAGAAAAASSRQGGVAVPQEPRVFYITTAPQAPQAPQGVAYYDNPPRYDPPAHNPDAPHQPQPIAQNIATDNLQELCVTLPPNDDHQD